MLSSRASNVKQNSFIIKQYSQMNYNNGINTNTKFEILSIASHFHMRVFALTRGPMVL